MSPFIKHIRNERHDETVLAWFDRRFKNQWL